MVQQAEMAGKHCAKVAEAAEVPCIALCLINTV